MIVLFHLIYINEKRRMILEAKIRLSEFFAKHFIKNKLILLFISLLEIQRIKPTFRVGKLIGYSNYNHQLDSQNIQKHFQ